jgi:hypothetical protein
MRLEVIRDSSGNCQTIQIFENREILKILKNKFKKIGIFLPKLDQKFLLAL